MSDSDYLTTKEVADLLRLKERKVYDLAARGEIPCVKATGKLLFPRLEVRRWMDSRGGSGALSVRPHTVLGSHDPLLEWALGASGAGMATLAGGSLDGLARFAERQGSVCGIHLRNTDREDWNIEAVDSGFADSPVVLIHWAKRQRGLIARPGFSIESLQDALRGRWVSRQADSGSYHILNQTLEAVGYHMDDITSVREARTETEAALALVEQQADVTFGLQCFATRYHLQFLPMCTEWFDLLVDRHAYFEQPFQRLLAFTQTDGFKAEAARFEGFDISELGAVRFNGAP